MLRISKLADYAMLIMHCLASSEAQLLSASDIAQNLKLSLPTVKKILKLLCEAQLLHSIRGSEGGYGLAEKTMSIPVASILTAVEGTPSLTECSATVHACTHSQGCSVKHNWQIINQFISNTLKNITLADMTAPFSLSDLENRFRRKG